MKESSKRFGDDCLRVGCEEDADRIVKDGNVMVSLCDEHADEVSDE